MEGAGLLDISELSERYLKSLQDDEYRAVVEYLRGLPADDARMVIDTGIQFYKSSAVNGIWFWRNIPGLGGLLGQGELKFWLEEGRRICRGSWECALSYLKETPEVIRNADRHTFRNWLKIGGALVRFSNHETKWYIQNSGRIFYQLEQREQRQLTEWILKIMDHSWPAAVACLKAWLEITRTGPGYKETILEMGYKLALDKPDDAPAFFQSAPEFMRIAGPEHLNSWVGAAYGIDGKRGVTGAFFRSSAGLAGKTGKTGIDRVLRQWSLQGNRLVKMGGRVAEEFFNNTPQVLKHLEWPDIEDWIPIVERVGSELNAEGAADFIKNTPELLQELDLREIIEWVGLGLSLGRNDKKTAYFSLKSQESKDAISQLRTGLHLESVKKILLIYCEGLTGHTVTIRNASELPSCLHRDDRLFGTLDTRRLFLPDVVKVHEGERDNLRLYRVMLMHLVAHREFGTLRLTGQELKELSANPLLGDVFELVEDTRVDYLSMKHYPGLTHDMKLLLASDLHSGPDSGPEWNLDRVRRQLYQLLWPVAGPDKTADIPVKDLAGAEIEAVIGEFWRTVTETGASPRDSLILAWRISGLLLKNTSPGGGQENETGKLRFRGRLRYDLIYTSQAVDREIEESYENGKQNNGLGSDEELYFDETAFVTGQTGVNLNDEFYLRLKKLLYRFYEDELNPYRLTAYYDEWDRTLNDYKKDWCKVREILLKPSTAKVVHETLEHNRGMISTVKRYFGMLRPDRFRRYRRQEDGEDVDIDAVIEAMIEIKAGVSPAGGFYVRRDKRERDVAVGFLLDLSYSTEEVVSGSGKTILDVEMESVIVMAEALEVLGDKYAIYGFNSDKRDKVNFYVVKDFEEPYTLEVKQRFGGLQSNGMTRLASAVRHAVAKMEKLQAAVKILIVLSDGRPFDFDYNSGLSKEDYEPLYPESDTMMCLREARMKGVNPFCITVDTKGEEYLEYIFGNVSYIIINDVNALPTKLTETYKNLTT